jgi:Zn-dependent peptidase ImmA (M78 family)
MTRAKKRPDPETRAREILADYGITHWPIPVDAVARKLGITLTFVPLDEALSGMIFMKGTAHIVINSLHHQNRQRFTISHEVGHFALHMPEIGSEVHVDKKFLAFARNTKSSEGSDLNEIEANRFAACLLVPRAFLIHELRGRILDVEDEELVEDLAKKFQVSRQMMTFRIAGLAERG